MMAQVDKRKRQLNSLGKKPGVGATNFSREGILTKLGGFAGQNPLEGVPAQGSRVLGYSSSTEGCLC